MSAIREQRILCVPRVKAFVKNESSFLRFSKDLEDIYAITLQGSSDLIAFNAGKEIEYTDIQFEGFGNIFRPDIEHRLCDLNIFELPRIEVEGKEDFQQLVVGCFITQGYKCLLLKNKSGDMNNAKGDVYTIIQGHCELFGDMTRYSTLDNVIIENLYREFNEEVGYDFKNIDILKSFFLSRIDLLGTNHSLSFSPYINYICATYNDFCLNVPNAEHDISYYHIGYIFRMDLPDDIPIENFYTNEPDKNEVVIVDVRDKELRDKYDSWVKLMIG